MFELENKEVLEELERRTDEELEKRSWELHKLLGKTARQHGEYLAKLTPRQRCMARILVQTRALGLHIGINQVLGPHIIQQNKLVSSKAPGKLKTQRRHELAVAA